MLIRRIAFGLALLAAGWLSPGLSLAQTVTNVARGGIGGVDNGTLVGGDGTGLARISLQAADLALVKQARDAAGLVLPDGATVNPGQEIYFVLVVDNPTLAAADSLEILDVLDETQFTYSPNSLEMTILRSGSDDAQIWAATWSPITDAEGGPDDLGSVVDTGGPGMPDRVAVGAVPGQVNVAATLPADSMLAVRFRVRVN